ncbi:putative transcription regulator IWS1 family [Helianthus annuus]|nr:putative transcription regulator IWS1 family [Helianthus annuus]
MKKRTVPEFAVDMVRDDGSVSVSGCGNRKKKFFRDGGNSNKIFKRSGDAPEVKEMWDTIVRGGDSEEEKKGIQRELDDDYFIDDSGVNPVNRQGSNRCGYSSSRAPKAEEGEEDDEIKELFKTGKKKKKTEKTAMEIAIVVEKIMAELEVFLDHGVLTLLKNWLEPLPDGSLPNRNIRTAILEILTEFPIDLYQDDRREQLKKSGIGKVGLIIVSKFVVMFMSKSDEETASNRKLAKDLVDKWSRQIFHISNRFEDRKDERILIRRPSIKIEPKSGNSTSTLRASRPGTMPLHFVVRPQSKIDPDEVKARAKQAMQEYQRRVKMNKRLRQLKKKKQLQAIKLSVEGRGMIKYV